MKYLTFSIAFLFSILIIATSCNRKDVVPPETTDSTGVAKQGKIIIRSSEANRIPIIVEAAFNSDAAKTLNYSAAFDSTDAKNQDIKVSFSASPDLVARFNSNYMTYFEALPDTCFELQTSSVIPAGKTTSPALELTLKQEKNIPSGDYLLGISVSTESNVPTDDESGILYFLIRVKTNETPGGGENPGGNNNSYRLVFADDGLNPKALYFVGKKNNEGEDLVWKYDIKGDSVIRDFPKSWATFFNNPYQGAVPEIEAVAWLRYDYDLNKVFDQTFKSYFIGNGSCFTFDVNTQEKGTLLSVKDLALGVWPPSNFSQKLECGFFFEPIPNPDDRSNYFFAEGGTFERQHVGPARGWYFPAEGHDMATAPLWADMPESFLNRGFTGSYYDNNERKVHFFSGDEVVVLNPDDGFHRTTDVQKISDVYKGL